MVSGSSRRDGRRSGPPTESLGSPREQSEALAAAAPRQSQGESGGRSYGTPLLRHLESAAGDTPRIMDIIREAEDIYKNDKHMLANVYSTAMNLFGPLHSPQVDEFRDLSVKCMRVLCQIDPIQARELYKLLCACSHGKADARIYEARAAMEEQLGDTREALRILQEGLRAGAQPPGMLRRLLQRLRPRALQLPEGTDATPQVRGTPCKVPQYSICTPEHNTARSPRCQRPETPAGPSAAAKACAGADEPAAGPGSLGEELRSLFTELREELLREVRTAQRAALEQGLRLQAQLHQDLQGLRAEAQQRCDLNSHERAHKCPRCCREAVEGAVDALMTGVEEAVGDALEIERLQLQGEGWQALADEVWESISVVNSLRQRRDGAANPAQSVAGVEDLSPHASAELPGRLEGLAPLRALLGPGGRAAAQQLPLPPVLDPASESRHPLEPLATARSLHGEQRQAWRETPSCVCEASPDPEAEEWKENARSSWASRDAAAKFELGMQPSPCPKHGRVQCFLR